jgi:catechol 2,3-dioxygenase
MEAGSTLPAAATPGLVRLQVSDLDRSLEFYEGLLGMSVVARSDGVVRLGAAGGAALLELRSGAVATASRRGRLGLYHFAVLLPDRAALGRILAHLVGQGVHPGAADHLVSEALYLQDPDDLGIEIYRDRPRSEWSQRRGEIAMASEPLDGAGVIAAGDGAWQGMPSGTRMGHIHLHVGDMRAARTFYGDALGFDVTVSSYPGALFLSAGGYHHHLGLNTWAGPQAQPPAPSEPQLLSWDLVLPADTDVAAAADRLERAGHPSSADGTGARTVADPWHTTLRLTTASV